MPELCISSSVYLSPDAYQCKHMAPASNYIKDVYMRRRYLSAYINIVRIYTSCVHKQVLDLDFRTLNE